MKIHFIGCSILLLLASAATSQTPPQWQEVVHRIETLQSNPLAPDAKEQGAWILGWLTSQTAVSITVCSTLTVPLTEKGDMVGNLFSWHGLLGAAKYALTVPQAEQTRMNMNLATMNGALDAYQKMVTADEANQRKRMEDVLKLRQQGKLEEYVRKHSKQCEK